MNTQDPINPAPPITAIPDYVWCRRYDRPSFEASHPVKKEKDIIRRFLHPNAETALRAAKHACRAHPSRWFGRSTPSANQTEFLIYEGGKIIERHVAG